MRLVIPSPFRCGTLALLSLLWLSSVRIDAQTTSPTSIGQTLDADALDKRAAAEEELKEERKLEAEQQLKREEHQRILGFMPNFNTADPSKYVPLTPGQKIRLAAKTSFDPVTFGVAALDAAIGQGQNSFDGYGQGAQGYGKRLGAAYVDSVDGTMIGNAFLPILFRQDPRYFRKGVGTFKSRLLYSMSTTVRARSDDGRWVPNYSNVLGNVAAGGIANLYYPASDRGVGLTFQRALTVTAEGVIGAFLVEFWPDVSHHFAKKRLARQAALNNP